MSQTYPVPSTGALRVLRRIALGTSCTIAFGAGIITEDRRRRIHAARQVYENGRRIKASRKYHNAGSAALASFEEDISTYGDNGHWKHGKPSDSDLNWDAKSPDIVLPNNHDQAFNLDQEKRPKRGLIQPALSRIQSTKDIRVAHLPNDISHQQSQHCYTNGYNLVAEKKTPSMVNIIDGQKFIMIQQYSIVVML